MSRDATAIEAREKVVKKEVGETTPGPKRKRGRPKHGEEAAPRPPKRLDLQFGRSLEENLFDYLPLIGDGFNQLRRYTPTFLETLTLKAAPAARELLAGVEVLKSMNKRQARKVPDNAPTSFVRKRWKNLIQTPDGLDRRFYELCVLSELKIHCVQGIYG